MPKKSTNAKKRLDKFYERAKREGFRSRAAFKLEQIDKKHSIFGSKAKCIVDLCAAPGSWMQMAQKLSPNGCFIVGVDLVPIRDIPGCIGLVGDIHKQTTLNEIKATLKGYKADVVLHDGAPNMMGNTVQDSYEQNFLALRSAEMATQCLKPGGTFVTKVFKSRTADMLRYVLTRVFKVVEQDKPIASRMQSMEMFYVCKELKDAVFDKTMFDPEHVFKEIEPVTAAKINLRKPEKVAKKAEGYEDGVEILYKSFTVAEFINSEDYEGIIEVANEITLEENSRFRHHPLTTPEILACFKDIKLLNRKDIRQLFIWRKKVKKELDEEKAIAKARGEEPTEEEVVPELTEEEKATKELEEVEKELQGMKAESDKADKKREKKNRKLKRELQLKLRKMKLTDTSIQENENFFDIKDMEKIHDDPEMIARIANEIEPDVKERRVQKERYRKDDFVLADDGMTYVPVGELSSSSDSDCSDEEIFTKGVINRPGKDGFEIVPQGHGKTVRFADDDSDSDDEDLSKKKKSTLSRIEDEEADSGLEDSDEEVVNPLTTDLRGDDKEARRRRVAEAWLNEEIDSDADSNAGMDMELDNAVSTYLEHGGSVQGEKRQAKCLDSDQEEEEVKDPAPKKQKIEPTKSTEVIKAPEDTETPTLKEPKLTVDDCKDKLKLLKKVQNNILKKGFPACPKVSLVALKKSPRPLPLPCINTVDMTHWGPPAAMPRKKFPPMTPHMLALAAQVVKSAKSRRDYFDQGWNRYMKAEEEAKLKLPEFFTEYENKNQRAFIEVDEKEEKFYEIRNRNVNVRTIKKVMEAKARKKRRFKKTMQKVVKKAEALQGSSNMSEKEKTDEINKMYKKAQAANAPKKKNLVVMTKGKGGKAPKGQKGPYKMVDARMKTDIRTKMKQMKKSKTFGRRKRR